MGARQAARSRTSSSGYISATVAGDLGYSLKFRGEPVADVIASRFWPTVILFGFAETDRDHRRPGRRGVRRLATGERRRSGRQRDQPDPLLDAVLRARDAADHHLRGDARLVPDVRDAHARRQHRIDRGAARRLPAPPGPAPRDRVARADRQYSILMRSSIIETRSEDYVTTARAKGLKDGRVLRTPCLPERAAADGHDHRHQPRLRRGRRHHGRGRVQLAGPRDADRRRPDVARLSRSCRASSCSCP